MIEYNKAIPIFYSILQFYCILLLILFSILLYYVIIISCILHTLVVSNKSFNLFYNAHIRVSL